MTEKRFIKELCEELIKSIKTKKDVYLFSYGLDDEENKYSKEEDDNSINYYAWIAEMDMMAIQKALFQSFWLVEEEDMDKLHIVLDYVASENITDETSIEDVDYYNRLFMFWDK